MKRDSKEIEIQEKYLVKNNIQAKIGAAKNKSNPSTVYLSISFWAKPKKESPNTRDEFMNSLQESFDNSIKKQLAFNELFPFPEKNIYILNIPESFGNSDKKSFVSMEVYLHTLNIKAPNSVVLNKKEENPLLQESIKLINEFENQSIFSKKSNFDITKKK